MDKILLTVSSRVSPLLTDEDDAEKLITSADNLFSANSNDILVRVEFSKKILATVTSRKVGTLLMGPVYNFFEFIGSIKYECYISWCDVLYA
jgi:hypothetical protein